MKSALQNLEHLQENGLENLYLLQPRGTIKTLVLNLASGRTFASDIAMKTIFSQTRGSLVLFLMK